MKSVYFIALKLLKANKESQNIAQPTIRIGTIGVALGICIMILSLAVIKGFKNEILKKLSGLTAHVVVMPYQTTKDVTENSLSINADTLSLIKKNNVVEDAQPVCMKNGILKVKEENEGIVIKGVQPSYNWQFIQQYLVAGNMPQFQDTVISKDVIISKKLADKMNLVLNQKLIVYFINKTKDTAGNVRPEYRSRGFYIKGIFNAQLGELDNQLMFADVRHIQKLNGWQPNQFSQIEVYAKKGHSPDDVIEKIIDILPFNYQVLSVKELYSNIFNWLDMIDINGIIIIVLMLMVAGINMVSALIILILEKVNLIGILKSFGLSNAGIKNIFLLISLKILFQGIFVGNIIALLLMLLQYHFHVFSLNPDAYYVSYIPVEWNLSDWVILNAGTIGICLLGMFIPTFLITRLSPIKILKWE